MTSFDVVCHLLAIAAGLWYVYGGQTQSERWIGKFLLTITAITVLLHLLVIKAPALL